MFAIANTFTINGIEAIPVRVECYISQGLPAFEIVGLASAAVREARERVRSAIKNSGFTFPNRKIIVNLAPADVRKEGSHFDLAIAVGILLASGQLEEAPPLEDYYLAGELSLNGELRAVPGVLPMALALSGLPVRSHMLVPGHNKDEAALAGGLGVYPFSSLGQVAAFFMGSLPVYCYEGQGWRGGADDAEILDFADVKGQESAKRALQVAAAGLHNLLMIGPPGTGKTMLARRLPSILPDMTREEVLETTSIYSSAGMLNASQPVIQSRPFRSPHKNASAASIVGGGRMPRPGEISLAQNGVLFLDELPEFSRDVLEALRQPLEDKKVSLARAQTTLQYPCRFALVAALNPCQCGHFGSETECRCSPLQIQKYLNRISGPLLDRIDIQTEVSRIEISHLSGAAMGLNSAQLKEQVIVAREMQNRRYARASIKLNSEMRPADLRRYCKLSAEAETLLKSAFSSLQMSARAYERILKMARTIADLEATEQVQTVHLSEAIQYRSLDRKYWHRY